MRVWRMSLRTCRTKSAIISWAGSLENLTFSFIAVRRHISWNATGISCAFADTVKSTGQCRHRTDLHICSSSSWDSNVFTFWNRSFVLPDCVILANFLRYWRIVDGFIGTLCPSTICMNPICFKWKQKRTCSVYTEFNPPLVIFSWKWRQYLSVTVKLQIKKTNQCECTICFLDSKVLKEIFPAY